MKHYSPLRYPGGKAKLSSFMKGICDSNLIGDGTYVEPFAGGASVALNLLIEEYVSNIVINDIDKAIGSFWYSILNHTEEFCKRIYDAAFDVSNWDVQKAIYNGKHEILNLDLGFATFFLNRTNRSGVLKAGIIGGKDQAGPWKMDARFNKKELIRRVEKIALYKDRIRLYNLDACDFLNQLRRSFNSRTLIYFDPPYYVKGKDLYTNFYRYSDHNLLSNEISTLTIPKWLVTYDDTPEIKKLYSSFRKVKYALSYSLINARMGNEIMFFSNNLKVPKEMLPKFI